ncbi:hypothetical protein BC829DRAFT_410953, partial [Chytridium lagenaria]
MSEPSSQATVASPPESEEVGLDSQNISTEVKTDYTSEEFPAELRLGKLALRPGPNTTFKQCEDLMLSIHDSIDTVQHQRHSLMRLLERTKGLLICINACLLQNEPAELEDDGVFPLKLKTHVDSLISMLISADEFVKKQSMQKFVNRQNVEARLLGFHQELAAISQDLSLAIEIDLKKWRVEDREDRAADLAELEITLKHLIDNDYKILNALELKQQEYLEAMEYLEEDGGFGEVAR